MNNTQKITQLVNFHVPVYLLNHFDSLVKFKHISRTGMLNHLIGNYVDNEYQKLNENGQIKQYQRSSKVGKNLENGFKDVTRKIKQTYISDTNYDTGSDFLLDLGK